MNSAVLLMNLGTPKSPTHKNVGSFLSEFLMDPLVIQMPWLLRALLIKGLVVPFRASRSAEAYRSIWSDRGSPLMFHSKSLARGVQEVIGDDIPLELAMRYGNPSIGEAVEKLLARQPKLERMILFPLYPQYAESSWETSIVAARQALKKADFQGKTEVIKPFYGKLEFHNLMASLITENHPVEKITEKLDQIIFSFHSLPVSQIKKMDPNKDHCLKSDRCCYAATPANTHCYRHHCVMTAQGIMRELSLEQDMATITFQSRLGRAEWIGPNTVTTILDGIKKGHKRIAVICPSFVTDCLETLEEMGIRMRKDFLAAGGKEFHLIPCLNDNPKWIRTLGQWIQNT